MSNNLVLHAPHTNIWQIFIFFPCPALIDSEHMLCGYVCARLLTLLSLLFNIGSGWGWGYREHGLGFDDHADV